MELQEDPIQTKQSSISTSVPTFQIKHIYIKQPYMKQQDQNWRTILTARKLMTRYISSFFFFCNTMGTILGTCDVKVYVNYF